MISDSASTSPCDFFEALSIGDDISGDKEVGFMGDDVVCNCAIISFWSDGRLENIETA
jgi:hypothetical protein